MEGIVKTKQTLKGGMAAVYAKDGFSAYEVAVNNGFKGTEAEWLASLKGKDGVNGADGAAGKNGADGKDGADGYTPIKDRDYFDGKSAYEIALEKGFEGTAEEWLASLKGEKGADGKAGANGKDYVLTATDKAEIADMVLAGLPVYSGEVENV